MKIKQYKDSNWYILETKTKPCKVFFSISQVIEEFWNRIADLLLIIWEYDDNKDVINHLETN